jgi:hypothetical protein
MSAYKIIDLPNTQQTLNDLSFKGGIPNIPQRFELPYCKLCGAEMTFFFQIAFPEKHVWGGKALALFHCTSCWDFDNYWPNTVYSQEYTMLPNDFLDTYQTNFRIYVFDVAEATKQRYESKQILKFERLEFETISPSSNVTKLGGKPNWSKNRWDGKGADKIYKQVTYMGGGVVFLLQIKPDWTFEPLDGVPEQAPGGGLKKTYSIFRGPHVYFLGTTAPKLMPPRVLLYALA